MNANNYTYFLEVKAGKLHSYFNLRNKLINLHISVPNIDFDIISTYFLGANKKEKAIIVHISDQTKKRICNNTGGKVLLKKRIYFSEVKPTLSGEILDLNKDDKLKVYVINDFPTDFDNNKVRYFSNLRKKFTTDHSWGCGNTILNNYPLTEKSVTENIKFSSSKDEYAMPEEAGGGVIVAGP